MVDNLSGSYHRQGSYARLNFHGIGIVSSNNFAIHRPGHLSFSTVALNNGDWSEIIWLPENFALLKSTLQ